MKRAKAKLQPCGESEQELLRSRRTAPSRGEESWRVLRVQSEIVDGFEYLRSVGPAVCVFGSARTPSDQPIYEQARQLGSHLANRGYGVITGGGPGIMEAANRGAQPETGPSVGLNIELPFEQAANPYLDISLEFRYFFVRKLMFVKHSFFFVFFAGGFGTLDELFDVITLIQTEKIERFRIVLFGSDYWRPLLTWLQETVCDGGYISRRDVDMFELVDDPADVCNRVEAFAAAHDLAPQRPKP